MSISVCVCSFYRLCSVSSKEGGGLKEEAKYLQRWFKKKTWLELPPAMDYAILCCDWPHPPSVLSSALSKTEHCTQQALLCLYRRTRPFYVPYLLFISTLSLLPSSRSHSLPPSLCSLRPFLLWQTTSCSFLCLHVWWLLMRKINK